MRGRRKGEREREEEIPKQRNWNCATVVAQFQGFSCTLLVSFHEKIARLVTRFPGTRLQRFRAYFIARFSVYTCFTDGVTRNRAGTRCR